ncbi:MAG: heavy metal translocating P-type ATPase metal-binding domain-containing protein [Acidobacteria bacterium]|nr:heavy metal translocating P-type ATPase metal-binding domain-containing protein [Acidobacteriota bacterium]
MNCDLCGLPAGAHPLEKEIEGQARAFCCLGCLNVYTILLESGVLASGADFRDSEIYRQSLKLGLISNRDARQAEIPAGAERREVTYRLSGMWCASCGWLIEHRLTAETGIVSADVLFASDLLKVTYCPQFLPPSRIPEAVASLGYKAEPQAGESLSDRRERRDLHLHIGLAGFLWMNVMLASLVIYASYWEAISDTARRVIPWVLAGLTAPAIFYSAWPILRVAWLGLRQFTLRMEALLALGILAAFTYSVAQAFLGGKEYYFDTACAIITLVLLGKLLERGAKERTAQAITLLYRMMPNKARLLDNGREHFVSVDALHPGGVFLVKAGERIPADGIVVAGSSHADESILTGESVPRQKAPGSSVIGGSLNCVSPLEIRATHSSQDSTLAHIIRGVEQAMSSRAPIERVVDRVSRVFVPAVIVLSLITLIACLALRVPADESLMRAIAVLVIACPCALGIATPLAITAAVGAASRRGILIRESRVLEEAGTIGTMILDKTGTVTEGDFRLIDFYPPELPLPLAAAVERYSEHPLGRAIARAVAHDEAAASNIRVTSGSGISGVVNGIEVAIGASRLLPDVPIPESIQTKARQWEALGHTVVFVYLNRQASGSLALGDSVRPGARELIAELHRRGVHTVLLSGDSVISTEAVARQIGAAEVHAGARPDDKQEFVAARQSRGQRVAMAGDGVNDAPALAAAHLGIAMGHGADIALQAAPVVIMSGSIDSVTDVFRISQAALRVIRQNLFWAFFYNAAGIALAAFGILTPILAAGAMVLSSLSVIGNSLRLRSVISRNS